MNALQSLLHVVLCEVQLVAVKASWGVEECEGENESNFFLQKL